MRFDDDVDEDDDKGRDNGDAVEDTGKTNEILGIAEARGVAVVGNGDAGAIAGGGGVAADAAAAVVPASDERDTGAFLARLDKDIGRSGFAFLTGEEGDVASSSSSSSTIVPNPRSSPTGVDLPPLPGPAPEELIRAALLDGALASLGWLASAPRFFLASPLMVMRGLRLGIRGGSNVPHSI